jgi:hypothetical protein
LCSYRHASPLELLGQLPPGVGVLWEVLVHPQGRKPHFAQYKEWGLARPKYIASNRRRLVRDEGEK